MNAALKKILIVTGVISMSCASYLAHAEVQSTEWPVVKTCGKALSVLPLKGHLWAFDQYKDPKIAADSIASYTSTDSSGIAIKVANPAEGYNYVVQGSNFNEFLYLSGSSPTKINVVKQNGQVFHFNLDESQLSWNDVYPNSNNGHYSVLALDATNNLFLLDVSIDNQIKTTVVAKLPYTLIPDYANSAGSVSVSPDGKFVSYGDISTDINIFSVQAQKIVADFKVPQGGTKSYIIWSSDTQVLAYAYTGYLNGDWKMFAIGYDNSVQEVVDLSALISSHGFVYSDASPYDQNQSHQINLVLEDNQELTGHLFILDSNKRQIIDTCLATHIRRVLWINSDYLFVVAQDQVEDTGITYSLIISSQTSDYYKITYDPILLPVGWVTDPSVPTLTPGK